MMSSWRDTEEGRVGDVAGAHFPERNQEEKTVEMAS